MRKIQKSSLFVGFGIVCLLAATSARAQDLIEFPNDTDATIQEAVIRAGCGGTVHLAPGTYTGTELSDDTGPIFPGLPDIKVGHIFMECGGRLIGSGVDETIIDGSNSPSPALGSPVVGLGFDPFNVHPVTEDYEVSDLTIRTSTANTTPQALAMGWADGIQLHHLRIEGFNTAIRGDLTNEVSIHHIIATGQGAGIGRCIEFRELNFFLPGALPPNGHMVENSIHHNLLSNCLFGININNNEAASVHHNTIQNTGTGVQYRAVNGSEFHHNIIAKSALRGLNLINAVNSEIHHNSYCENAVDIRFGPSTVSTLFGIGPSGGIDIHHETFLGAGTDILDNDPNDTGYSASKNTSIANGSCPDL